MHVLNQGGEEGLGSGHQLLLITTTMANISPVEVVA